MLKFAIRNGNRNLGTQKTLRFVQKFRVFLREALKFSGSFWNRQVHTSGIPERWWKRDCFKNRDFSSYNLSWTFILLKFIENMAVFSLLSFVHQLKAKEMIEKWVTKMLRTKIDLIFVKFVRKTVFPKNGASGHDCSFKTTEISFFQGFLRLNSSNATFQNPKKTLIQRFSFPALIPHTKYPRNRAK